MSTILLIVLVLVLISVIGGGYGHTQGMHPGVSFGPLGLILVVVLLLYVLGYLH